MSVLKIGEQLNEKNNIYRSLTQPEICMEILYDENGYIKGYKLRKDYTFPEQSEAFSNNNIVLSVSTLLGHSQQTYSQEDLIADEIEFLSVNYPQGRK